MVWLGYRFDKTQRFTKIQLQDDGLSDDGTAGDGRYGALINANGTHVEYYFFADNNNAGIFLPARAEHEFFNKIFNTQGYAIGDISINELLASNSIQLDEYAEDDDWIELYNNSNNIINLQGLFLTDDGAILNKWPLPSLHIAPHGFSMVWADDDAWQLSAHTNFKLSAAGGTLMLTDGSNILDNIIYPIQQSDVSYGRFPDGSSGSLQFMSTTFNGNNSGIVQVEENNPSFSIYPNPANDILNINTNKTIREIKIMNGMGQMMNTAIIKGNNTIVNVSFWADGVYHISLEMEDGEILHRSFVKG
jgi:hypothetical protein